MDERYKKILNGLLWAFIAAAVLYVIFVYALPLLLPFVLAWVVAALLQPVIKFLNGRLRIPKKLAVLILVVGAIALIAWGITAIVTRLVYEISSLASLLQQQIQRIANDDAIINGIIDWVNEKLPFHDFSDALYQIWDNLDGYLIDAISAISGNFDTILTLLTDTVMLIPGILIFIVVTIISCFYLACDFKKINEFIALQLPTRVRVFGGVVKRQLFTTVGKYVRAYSLIMLITFTELFVGFTILGIRYSFVLALITAVIDIMPVLGTGLVVLPWSVYCFFTGDMFLGIGLLILYLAITIIRQIIEPRIVGSYIGLYPLTTLIAMYVGTQLMGVFGLFFFPIAIILLKKLNEEGHVRLWKIPDDPVEDEPARVAMMRRLKQRAQSHREKRDSERQKHDESSDCATGAGDENDIRKHEE